jgi:single-strand DNA-binding protein
MSELLSVTGLVATTPRHLVTQDGLPITSFRLASSQRRFDRSQNRWIDGETNWFTVTAFRQLAINSSSSVNKGDRIVVAGKLRVRDWDNGERAGTSVEIEADSIGTTSAGAALCSPEPYWFVKPKMTQKKTVKPKTSPMRTKTWLALAKSSQS